MASSISYAGVDLILGATPEVDDWVSTHIRPEDLYEETFNLGTRLPWLWYNWPPKVRVGEVVWPNDASRWGYAHFYAGQTEVDAILAITSGEGFQNLVINANLAVGPASVTFSMTMLPPRPLSRFADIDGQVEPLYLLTFVDYRFLWWQNHVENPSIVEGTTTWANLFTALETALSLSFTQDAVDADYGFPSPLVYTQGTPVPVLFDLWAYWTGRRVVVDKNGTVNVLNPDSCATRAASNATTSGLLTGGRFPWVAPEGGTDTNTEVLNSFLPDSVSLLFPEIRASQYTSRVYPIIKTMADAANPTLSGITGDGASYGYNYPKTANFVSSTSTVPINTVALEALAAQANVDFYKFQLGYLDQQESGTRNYGPDGLHRIEWLFTQNYASTHIVREPYPPPDWNSFGNKTGFGTNNNTWCFDSLAVTEDEFCLRSGIGPYGAWCFNSLSPTLEQICPQWGTSWCFVGLAITYQVMCGEGGLSPNDPYTNPTRFNAKVCGTTTQTIAAGATAAITFATEEWDTAAFWAGGDPTKFTFVTAGNGKYHIDYAVVASVTFSGSVSIAPASVTSILRLNGTTEVTNSKDGNTVTRLAIPVGTVTTTYDLDQVFLQHSTDVQVTTKASDYYQVVVTNNSSVTLTIDRTKSGFSIHKIEAQP